MLSMQFLNSKLGATPTALGRRARVSRISEWISTTPSRFGSDQRTTALSGEDTSYSVTLPTGWLTSRAESTIAL